MDLLIIAGVLAIVGLVAVGVLAFVQHRREGTVKAVVAPRQSLSRVATEAEDEGAADTGAK
jgi:hypothetical protein